MESHESKIFNYSKQAKKVAFICMGLGVLGIVLSIVLPDMSANHYSRFWSNLLLNTYYFAGIAITGLFFLAAHQLGYGGWHVLFKRVPLAMSRYLFVIFGLVVLITAGLLLDWHNLYGHWAHPHEVAYADSGMAEADRIVVSKSPFLNKTMFAVIVPGFFLMWALFSSAFTKRMTFIKSFKEYNQSKYLSALFILVFAVSMSVLSWMFIMSLDPHWYSTLFGWYNFASYTVAGFAFMILILLYLKSKGSYPHLDENHLHDLGKYLFGFSVFYTYLWFSQFLLIWYANIPEATIWYTKRMAEPLFKFLFFFTFLINFPLPLLVLMRRDSKRKLKVLGFVAVMMIFGHYLDFYGMVMLEPNAVVEHRDDHHGDDHDDHHADDAGHDSEEVALLSVAEVEQDDNAHHGDDGHAEEGHTDEAHGGDHEDHHGEASEEAMGHDEHHAEDHGHGDNHGDGHHAEEP
ncbi:MAG: hypothetical protein VX611_01600, partial [Bacteroidota bacterium]|nr:hypothetical protein [Bacteroidota bacterium]